jgi:hypothetical protein
LDRKRQFTVQASYLDEKDGSIMLTIEMKRNAFRVLATLALAAAPAFASPITVANYNFEILPVGISNGALGNTCVGTGCTYTYNSPITGWTASALGYGQMQPNNPTNTSEFTVGMPNGSITDAWAGAGVTLSQQVGVVYAGEKYTLTVDVGDRAGMAFNGTIDLLVGGTVGSGAISGSAPGNGLWSTYTVTYVGTAADAGKALTIELNANTSQQAAFDNVRLDGAAPEPASLLLIGPALLFLGLRRRRAAKP